MRKIRGKEISMIFQEPMTSLNPVFTVGEQIAEAIRLHEGLGRRDAMDKTIEMLRVVHIPNPERRVREYPHQLSGGMRQRVMIAMALINSPQLLIADEPTTALDVTVQAQILELIQRLQGEFGTTVIVITHDLGIVADMADEVAVMYGARIVEQAPTAILYDRAEMPYTLGLLASIPRMDRALTERLDPIRGNPPSPINLPKGCVFQPRCKYWELNVDRNLPLNVRPELVEAEPGHWVRCHLPPEVRRRISREVIHGLTEVSST
jgi:peptide/nickel transport system ATP-binding protein